MCGELSIFLCDQSGAFWGRAGRSLEFFDSFSYSAASVCGGSRPSFFADDENLKIYPEEKFIILTIEGISGSNDVLFAEINAINNLSLREAERRSNPKKSEIAAPFGGAMTGKDIKGLHAYQEAYSLAMKI